MPSTKHDFCAHPECLRKEEKQLIKGRGLCRACYNKAQRQGWLHTWTPPAKNDAEMARTGDGEMNPANHGNNPTRPSASLEPLQSLPSLDGHEAADPPHPQTTTKKRSTPVEKIAKQARKTVKTLSNDFKVSVDFTAAAHVLEEIKVRAEREMRPVPLQILWELKRAVAGEEAA